MHSVSGEEDKYMKTLQTDTQTDGRTDKQTQQAHEKHFLAKKLYIYNAGW